MGTRNCTTTFLAAGLGLGSPEKRVVCRGRQSGGRCAHTRARAACSTRARWAGGRVGRGAGAVAGGRAAPPAGAPSASAGQTQPNRAPSAVPCQRRALAAWTAVSQRWGRPCPLAPRCLQVMAAQCGCRRHDEAQGRSPAAPGRSPRRCRTPQGDPWLGTSAQVRSCAWLGLLGCVCTAFLQRQLEGVHLVKMC